MSTTASPESQLGLIDANHTGNTGSTGHTGITDDAPLTAHQQLGFELGWDHARHAVAPPMDHLSAASLSRDGLHDGLRAGRAAFGARTLIATPQVAQWLALRLNAWLQHRSVELVEVTPNYLKQIGVSHCPVTRLAVVDPGAEPVVESATGSVVDRVRDDAGFAAGNLAVTSRKAQHAKLAQGVQVRWKNALQIAERIEAEASGEIEGLGAGAWRRLAVLGSFVEALPHAEACAIPLLMLPPNRLRLFNPVQALQAFVSQQLLTPGWSLRVNRFEALLPSHDLKQHFKRFFMALLPRVLERGKLSGSAAARWAVEDAWQVESVLSRWTDFARRLDPALCEALLCQAAARRLTTRTVLPFSSARATEGWGLPTQGYLPQRGESVGTRRFAVAAPRAVPAASTQQGRLC